MVIFGVLTGCHTRFADSVSPESCYSLSIPYVQGDSDGQLTGALIEAVQQAGGFRYVHSGGTLTLNVKILDRKKENIGFRFDPKRFTVGKRRIIPSEGRRKLLAEVSVIDSVTKKVLIGPALVVGICEFDHQNYSLNHDVNIFSLGQLSDIDTTYDVVDIPLNRDTARRIAEYLEAHYDELMKARLQQADDAASAAPQPLAAPVSEPQPA